MKKAGNLTVKQHRLKKAVHGGKVRRIREEMGREILDFSANLNPFPPPIYPDFSPELLAHYPDDDYTRLKEAIAGLFNRPVDEIAVGNGSIELIRLFAFATLSPGDRVRIHRPTFEEYELSSRLAGAVVAGPNEIADVTFVCNPNNPTGELLSREVLIREKEKAAAENGILFVDEAFIELSNPMETLSGECDPALFVLRSLTKSFAVPGIRFGYAFGDPALIEKIETLRPPWSVNAFAEQYALAAFARYGTMEESRNLIARERDWLVRKLSNFPLTIHPSSVNFLLITTERDVSDLCASLLSKGILVRDCHSFGLPRSFRIAVRAREENRQLIEVMEQCLP